MIDPKAVPLSESDAQAEYLHRLRHSTTHVMAQAVQELFPGTKISIGPTIDDGFYYDFDSPHTFTPDDLTTIETRMKEIVIGNHAFVMSTHASAESRGYWEKRGEKYKIELIDDLKTPTVTHCTHSTFTDLCRGGHVDTTADIRHFKLLRVAGAYWRGDEKRERLQRIYGTAWPTEEALNAYITRMEEAKKRDHRELGQRLGLFTIDYDKGGAGFVYWLPKGATIRRILEDYLKDLLTARGYDLVYTPHVARADLWKTSGHLSHYKDNMYPSMKLEEQEFLLKPMNCPGHILIYKSGLHSYRELPIRMAEFGTVYRFERSGVLHGLMRVRGFTQDDAHIFCRPDQVENEVVEIMSIIMDVLRAFGFNDFEINLSTQPKDSIGAPELWSMAQDGLKNALQRTGLRFDIDEGGGAFYGPKIDLKIKDALGRLWQCSTVQVDFNLPERFDVSFRDDKGGESRAVMIHRALFGSLERFFGVLIEHYAGAFPLWLAPVQAMVVPVGEKFDDYARSVQAALKASKWRVDVDLSSAKMGAKIREATVNKIPYMLVVGGREAENKTVSVRTREGKDLGALSLPDLEKLMSDRSKDRS
jgi:threonyl-tRNA synthetase